MNINIEKRTFFTSLLVAVAVISLLINIYLVFGLVKMTQSYEQKQINARILSFRNMFTEKVLLAEREVDFDTRLSLETAVRALNDQEIFDQWQKFTKSATKEEASAEAKKLLRILVQKTSF